MRLLHIDSSITGIQSVSRQLTAGIVARLKESAPSLQLTYRDLAADPLPQHTEALQALKAKPEIDRAAAAPELLRSAKILEDVLAEFLAADIVVIGAPMYNFGIPSQLKSWIDALAVPGKTFTYSAAGVNGLCGGKRLIIASSRGGFYSGASPMAALDHQESFLSGFFRFVGVTDLSFVRAEGVNYGPEQRQKSLDSALAEAAALVGAAA